MTYKTTTVKEFLGLSDEEEAQIESRLGEPRLDPDQRLFNVRLAVSNLLRRLRREHGVRQAHLAEALLTSQSRVAKMEQSADTVSLDLLVKAAFTVGATDAQVADAVRDAFPFRLSAAPGERLDGAGESAPYLTISAAAERARVTRQRIHSALKDGVLPAVPESESPVAGLQLIRAADLDHWRATLRPKGGGSKKGRTRRKIETDFPV